MSEVDKQRALLACCRPDGDPQGDRRLRGALQHMAADAALKDAFATQAGLDRVVGARVRAIPLPADFSLVVRTGMQRALRPAAGNWRGWLRQPALWAGLLAFAFLAWWAAYALYERARGFPGDDNVRALIEIALQGGDPATQHLIPIVTDADKLGDELFLQGNVDQYEVPTVFAHAKTRGFRVFDKNDSPVTQVQLRDLDIVLLFFRADSQGVDISPVGSWKRLDGEGWTAAAEVHNSECFVAICRGNPASLNGYLRKAHADK
jgi:hypothetical protein